MVDITDRQKTILRAAFEKMLKDLRNHEDGDDCGFAFPRRFASDITPDEVNALVDLGLLEGDNAEPEQAYRITKRGERLVSGADYLMVGKSYRHDDQKVTVVESSRLKPGVLRVVDEEGAEKWVEKNDLKPLTSDPFAHLEAARQRVEADQTARQRQLDDQQRALDAQRQRVQASKLKLALSHLGIETNPTSHQITVTDITFSIDAYDANGHISFALNVWYGDEHQRLIADNKAGDWTQAQADLAGIISKLRKPGTNPPDADADDTPDDPQPVPEPTASGPVYEVEIFTFDPMKNNGTPGKIARYLNEGWTLFTNHVVGSEIVYVFHRTVDPEPAPEPEREAQPPDDDTDPGHTTVSAMDKRLAKLSRERRRRDSIQPTVSTVEPDAIVITAPDDDERQREQWWADWQSRGLPEGVREKLERDKAQMNQQLIDNMRRRQAERAGQV